MPLSPAEIRSRLLRKVAPASAPKPFAPEFGDVTSSFSLGDKGQRFEIRAFRIDRQNDVALGWTAAASGGWLYKHACLDPSLSKVRVVDRKPDKVKKE